jgi:hypothetical protein
MWLFSLSGFRPPQHGDGMWAPLAYVIDVVGFLFGILVAAILLFIAWTIVPLLLH